MCLDITEAASFSEDVSPDITSGTDSTASVITWPPVVCILRRIRVLML